MKRLRPKILDDLDAIALRFMAEIANATGVPAPLRRKWLDTLKRLNRGYTDPDVLAAGDDDLEELLEDELEEELDDWDDPITRDDDDCW